MKLLVAALLLAPTLSLAHSQAPGFETEFAYSANFYKTYELKNNYNFPAVFDVEVLTKDMKPAKGWSAKKTTFKLMPNSKADVKLKFKVDGNKRKLLVCTTLREIGKDSEKASVISRICSRLIINDAR